MELKSERKGSSNQMTTINSHGTNYATDPEASMPLTLDSTLEDLMSVVRMRYYHNPALTLSKARLKYRELVPAATHICHSLQKESQRDVKIRELLEIEAHFEPYFAKSTLTPSSKHDYRVRTDLILKVLQELGFPTKRLEFRKEWESPRRAMVGIAGCPAIVIRMIELRLLKSQLSQEHIDAWKKDERARGLSDWYVGYVENLFFQRLSEAGLEDEFPLLDFTDRMGKIFRRTIPAMTVPLQTSVLKIVDWASDASFTENALAVFIGNLESYCGYFVNVLRRTDIKDFEEILNENDLGKYSAWLLGPRECMRKSIMKDLRGFQRMLEDCPLFKDHDKAMLRRVRRTIEIEPPSLIEERRGSRGIDWEITATMLDAMVRKHESRMDHDEVSTAWHKHDLLLATFLVKYPWPAKALYSCRIEDPKNIFEDKVPKGFPLSPEAQKRFDSDNEAKFWQFYFSASETPNRRAAYGLIPEIIRPLLVDFIDNHRQHLPGTPGTLFRGRDGNAMNITSFWKLVGDLTERYAGKHLTITALRWSYGWMWLEENPGERGIKSLADILWLRICSVRRMFKPKGTSIPVAGFGPAHARRLVP
jgi:hypothetical protein